MAKIQFVFTRKADDGKQIWTWNNVTIFCNRGDGHTVIYQGYLYLETARVIEHDGIVFKEMRGKLL